MKTSKHKNLTRQGNRIGKSQIHCNMEACGEQVKSRRSIPVAEVNQIVDQAVRQVKASRTIYDDRLESLRSIERNEAHIADLENMLHEAQLTNKRIRSDLAQINLAITRQLELDGE